MADDEPLQYIEPSNDTMQNPDAAQVVAFMRQNGDYWGPYSPVGRLVWQRPVWVSLLYIRHPRCGWYLQYDSEVNPPRHLVAVDPTVERGGWVEHWAEGETSYFPVECFLPQVVAERVVADFLATREPSPAVTWEPFDWRIHRREGPPDDEGRVVEQADFPDASSGDRSEDAGEGTSP